MKKLMAAFCFMIAISPLALAQDKAKADEKKAVTVPATVDEKKAAPATAKAKKEPTEKQLAQQAKMNSCTKDADDKKLKGDERKKFLSNCKNG